MNINEGKTLERKHSGNTKCTCESEQKDNEKYDDPEINTDEEEEWFLKYFGRNERIVLGKSTLLPQYKYPETIVDSTIILAKSLLTGVKPELLPEYEKIRVKETIWPKNGSLSMISGLHAVDSYVSSLPYDDSLKYCVDFMKQKVDALTSTYIYEVKWSVPTKEQPIQLSTANMYFNLTTYYFRHHSSPIDVLYSYENSSVQYKPGEIKFKDYLLYEIIESKTHFRNTNGFKMDTFL